MTDQILLKGSLVLVFIVWLIIKNKSRKGLSETTVTKPFRIAMYAVGIYFLVEGFLVDFLDIMFPPWADVPPIPDNENWVWAKLVATNFTFTLGLMFLSIAISVDKISTVWVTAILFMFIYNVRNSFINFFEIGVPEPTGGYGWLAVFDASIIWPATAAVVYQLLQASPNFQKKQN